MPLSTISSWIGKALVAIVGYPQAPILFISAFIQTFKKEATPHPYSPVKEGELRSPCPGLNTLANHGYLPRDGRLISAPQLIYALHTGLGVSIFYATFLVTYTFIQFSSIPSPIPFTLFQTPSSSSSSSSSSLSHFTSWYTRHTTIDLYTLALHDILEHDASMGHGDAQVASRDCYAPTRPDEELIRWLIKSSSDGGRTVSPRDAARVRVLREGLAIRRRTAQAQAQERSETAPLLQPLQGGRNSGSSTSSDSESTLRSDRRGLPAVLKFTAQGEWGLVMGLLGERGSDSDLKSKRWAENVDVKQLERWLREERLPWDVDDDDDDPSERNDSSIVWPKREIGFVATQLRAFTVARAMEEIRKEQRVLKS